MGKIKSVTGLTEQENYETEKKKRKHGLGSSLFTIEV